MTSHDNPSRISGHKRTANFATPSGTPHEGQGRRSGDGSKRRHRNTGGVRKELVIGTLMAGVLLVAVLGIWWVGRKHSAEGNVKSGVAEREESSGPREKWHGPMPSVIAERFTKAKTHEQRLELVRNPSQVGPAMEAFFKSGPGATEKLEAFYPVPSGSSGSMALESYEVEFSNAPKRTLSVSVDPQGAKVDFECYARFSSVPWDTLLTGKATEADEVRATLEFGGYYLHQFGDEEKWLHFKATSPDLPEPLDFYLDRQNPAFKEIKESVTRPIFRATVSVRSVNGSEKHRQFEMTALKALDWVEPG